MQARQRWASYLVDPGQVAGLPPNGATDAPVLVVRPSRREDAELMRQVVEMVGQDIRELRQEQLDGWIQDLTGVLLKARGLAPEDRDIAADNAALRAEYLRRTQTYSAATVHRLAGRTGGNAAETASRWLREGKVFAVRSGRENRFPAFQFRDGLPLPVLAPVLAALPADWSPWQVAFWFASGNGWLNGAAPEDRLSAHDSLLAAARHAGEPTIG